MKMILQSLILLLCFGALFLLEQTNLNAYIYQAMAGLIIIYVIISFLRRRKMIDSIQGSGNADIFIINCVIMLLIYATGALYSPIFFLVYFLAFGITYLFEPLTAFVFMIGAAAIFLPEALKNGAIESYLKVGSLLVISPLAYFFGKTFKDREKEQQELEEMSERSKDAADTIAKDVEEVITKEKKKLDKSDIEKLNEVLEETEEMRDEP